MEVSARLNGSLYKIRFRMAFEIEIDEKVNFKSSENWKRDATKGVLSRWRSNNAFPNNRNLREI